MQPVTRGEHRLGAEQGDLAIRDVEREIDGAARQRELADVGKPALIGVGADEAQQFQRRVAQRVHDRVGLGAADHHCGIDFPALERAQPVGRSQREHRRIGGRHAVGGEQRLHERACAAAEQADGDPFAEQWFDYRGVRAAMNTHSGS